MLAWSIEKVYDPLSKKTSCYIFLEQQPKACLAAPVTRFLKLPKEQDCQSSDEGLAVAIQRAGYLYALTRLAQKAYTTAELEKMLKLQLIDPSLIPPILEKLVSGGYCQDQELAASIQRRLAAKGKSQRYIQLYLAKKGLQAQTCLLEEIDQIEPIKKWLTKWAQKENVMLKPIKYWQRLAQRGFNSEHIQTAWQQWRQDNPI